MFYCFVITFVLYLIHVINVLVWLNIVRSVKDCCLDCVLQLSLFKVLIYTIRWVYLMFKVLIYTVGQSFDLYNCSKFWFMQLFKVLIHTIVQSFDLYKCSKFWFIQLVKVLIYTSVQSFDLYNCSKFWFMQLFKVLIHTIVQSFDLYKCSKFWFIQLVKVLIYTSVQSFDLYNCSKFWFIQLFKVLIYTIRWVYPYVQGFLCYTHCAAFNLGQWVMWVMGMKQNRTTSTSWQYKSQYHFTHGPKRCTECWTSPWHCIYTWYHVVFFFYHQSECHGHRRCTTYCPMR